MQMTVSVKRLRLACACDATDRRNAIVESQSKCDVCFAASWLFVGSVHRLRLSFCMADGSDCGSMMVGSGMA